MNVTQFVSADGRCAGGDSPFSVSGNVSFGNFDTHITIRKDVIMISLKNDKEIQKIREAGHIVFLAHEAVKAAIKPGITTKELDEIAENLIVAHGAFPSCKGYPEGSNNPFPATCCISVNDEIIHGIPSNKVLKDGDLVSVDIVADKDGYFADAARSYVVGRGNENANKLIKITEGCFWEGVGCFDCLPIG